MEANGFGPGPRDRPGERPKPEDAPKPDIGQRAHWPNDRTHICVRSPNTDFRVFMELADYTGLG